MTDSQHSPVPWRYNGYDDHCGVGRRYHEITCTDGFEVINQSGIVASGEEGDANARLIVRSVNNFDGLLEACKSLLAHCIDDLPVLPAEYQTAVNKARAAIAKADPDSALDACDGEIDLVG